MTSILDPDGDEVKTGVGVEPLAWDGPLLGQSQIAGGFRDPYHADWQYWQRPSSRHLITVAHMATELLTLGSLILNNQPVVI